MKEENCRFSELNDSDFRDILENLHNKLSTNSDNELGYTGFESVSKYSLYSNVRATHKVKSLLQALGMEQSYQGFKVENHTAANCFKDSNESITIPIARFDENYELTDDRLQNFLDIAHRVTVNTPYLYDNRPPNTAISHSGNVLHRPNHNGTHGARQIKYVEALIAVIESSGNDQAKAVASSLTREEYLALRMAAYFLRVGRVDESGWKSKDKYQLRSVELFKCYAKQSNLTEQIIKLLSTAMNDSARPGDTASDKEKFLWEVLNLAHKIDLYRCCSPGEMVEFERQISVGLTNYVPASKIGPVVQYLRKCAISLMVATGSRIYGGAYDPVRFELFSSSALECFQVCDQVLVQNNGNLNIVVADEEDRSKVELAFQRQASAQAMAYSQGGARRLVDDYNAGRAALCVTMLGYQMSFQGYSKVFNSQTVGKMEREYRIRKAQHTEADNLGGKTNFSATAFNKYTQVSLIRSLDLANKGLCNVGFVLQPLKLEPILVAVAGDGWTKYGGKNVPEPTPSIKPDVGVQYKMHYHSSESDKVKPKNKAIKGTQSRQNNVSTIVALVKHTNKHGWAGQSAPHKKHIRRSGTTNELLFMPNTKTYFDAIDYIIVDNTQLRTKDVTKLAQWKGIVELSCDVCKPILVMEEDGLRCVASHLA